MSFAMYAKPIASGLPVPVASGLPVLVASGLPLPPGAPATSGLPAMTGLAEHNWTTAKSMSIYVHWVPDEMNEDTAKEFFSKIGTVLRVEFVRNKNEKSRMMFVHFQSWNFDLQAIEIRNNIGWLHPEEGYPLPIRFMVQGKMKSYSLMCRINTRAIPVVEYNTHQLSDMFERLNTRVSAELETVRNDNMRILEEFDDYREKTDKELADCKNMNAVLLKQLLLLKHTVVSNIEPTAYPSDLREIPSKPVLQRRPSYDNTDVLIDIQENLDCKFISEV